MSDGQTHSHFPLALLLAGGAAGRLKGGRHLTYPLRTPLPKAHLSVLDMMEVPTETLTDATGINERLDRLSDL